MDLLKYVVAAIATIAAGWTVKVAISNRSSRSRRTTIVSQKNNREGGDIVGGDMHTNNGQDRTSSTSDPQMAASTSTPTSIPFVDVANLQGRIVMTSSFYDGQQWRMWTRTNEGLLIELKVVELADGFYFAKEAQTPNDTHFSFLNFVAQHVSFPEIKFAVSGIMDDISNLTASLSKLKLLHTHRNAIGMGVTRMAATEVEYILFVCRSLFDLLQEIIEKLWQMVKLSDPSVSKKKLKPSFAEMAVFQEAPVAASRLVEKYGLPQPLAEFYESYAPFFLDLRAIRNNLVHRGSSIQTIFCDDADFLISGHLKPFKTMNIWRHDERRPNDLVPLLPAICSVIYRTLAVCEQFSIVMRQTFQLPPPLAPGMALFMRGPFNEFFLNAMTDAMHREAALVIGASSTSENPSSGGKESGTGIPNEH
jgi:hypothetical protein